MYVSVFCFKQKTAYEMRISDWSSDVCSSDLAWGVRRGFSGQDRDKPGLSWQPPFAILRAQPIVSVRRRSAIAGARGVRASRRPAQIPRLARDRKSVVSGKSVSVRVAPGGGSIIKKKKQNTTRELLTTA